MPTPINFAVLQSYVDAGDRVGYYSQLAEWGYRYGELAAGVVTGATLSGRAANSFFLDEAADQQASISPGDLASISDGLMRADFAARVNFPGSENGEELSVDTIRDYHRVVFSQFGVTVDAWTPTFALNSLATVAERDAFWDELLAQSNPFTATNVLISPTEGDSSLTAISWRLEIAEAGAAAIVTGSNSYGNYVLQLSNGGFVVGDGLASATLSGSSGNDVILGFAGADTLNGNAGNDRLYGGAGADVMNGGNGNDLLFGTDDDGLVFNGDFVAAGDRMDGQSGADTYYVGIGDVARDSGFDGALDVYILEGGLDFSDADGVYDGAGLIRGFGLPNPFGNLFRQRSASREDQGGASSSEPTLGDYLRAGSATYAFDDDGGRVLTSVADGRTITELDGNWGDGGFDLDVGREEHAVRGTSSDDTMAGSIDADILLGMDGNDMLSGADGDDELSGGGGNDALRGDGGDDDLYGDRGDDSLDGGAGSDRLWGGAGDDALIGGAGDDHLSGNRGDDHLGGGTGDDALRGGAGADQLYGAAGTDTLTGGTGDDLLTGGAGADTFRFAEGDGHDIVADFELGVDQLLLGDVLLDPRNFAPLGVTATAAGGDVVLSYGAGDTITLRDQAIADWTPPAAPDPFRIEAEAFTREAGFEVRANPNASGGTFLQASDADEQRATYTFDALAGLYDLTLGYFDESDGQSTLSVRVNGAEVDGFTWDADAGGHFADPTSFATRLIEGVSLRAGDVIELVGFRDGDEPLRIDYADLAYSGEIGSDAPDPFRVEAEAFTLDLGFESKTNPHASDGAFLQAGGSGEQRASYAFDAEAGLYDIEIGHFDESDGQSALALVVNGTTVASFVWDADAGGAFADPNSFAVRRVEDVALEAGDVIELVGLRDGDEPLRVDYLDFSYDSGLG